MKCGEVDLERGNWLKTETHQGNDRDVPQGDLALALLKRMHLEAGKVA
jgi:hypothetical protein